MGRSLAHHIPVRCFSLPSKLYPVSYKIEPELTRIKPFESISSFAHLTTSESIRFGLVKLNQLYNCIEDIIHSPQTHQSLRNPRRLKLVETALDASTELLDACCFTTDLVSTLKENIKVLQSALRRRGGDSSIESDIRGYFTFRKKSKKSIVACLKSLKKMETKISDVSKLPFVDHDMLMVINVLRESTMATIDVFRSILLFLAMSKKGNGWNCLMSKLISVHAEKDESKMLNEVVDVDVSLYNLFREIRKVDVQIVVKRLEKVDYSLESVEEGLDCLCRRLVQHRVSLLNILTP